jgi:hypothetical protein
MNDIDLLVRDADLEEAEGILAALGYEVAHDQKTKDELRRTHHHWVFRQTQQIGGGIPLELHWNLHPSEWPFRIDPESLWQRAVPCRIAGVAALGLAPEDLILHLSTHASRHRFNAGLIALCDIAAAIAYYGDRIDWAQLEKRAAEWRAGAQAYVSIQLAVELLAARVPSATLSNLAKQGCDNDLLRLARERLLEEKGPIREAADLLLRWRRRGRTGGGEAVRRAFLPDAVTHGRTNLDFRYPFHLKSLLARYASAIWVFARHAKAVGALAEREAAKTRLDAWCSPKSNTSEAEERRRLPSD